MDHPDDFSDFLFDPVESLLEPAFLGEFEEIGRDGFSLGNSPASLEYVSDGMLNIPLEKAYSDAVDTIEPQTLPYIAPPVFPELYQPVYPYSSPSMLVFPDATFECAPSVASVAASASAAPISSPTSSTNSDSNVNPKRKKRDRVRDVPDEMLPPDQLAKRQRRRELNKNAAQQSRARKQMRMEDLEKKVEELKQRNEELEKAAKERDNENSILMSTLEKYGLAHLVPRRVAGLTLSTLAAVVLLVMTLIRPEVGSEDFIPSTTTGRILQSFSEKIDDSGLSELSSRYPVTAKVLENYLPPRVRPPAPSASILRTSNDSTATSTELVRTEQVTALATLMSSSPEIADVVFNALEVTLSGKQFTHVQTEMSLWNAFRYLKEHAEPSTQYIICPRAHSINVGDNPTLSQHREAQENFQGLNGDAGNNHDTRFEDDISIQTSQPPLVVPQAPGRRVTFLLPSQTLGHVGHPEPASVLSTFSLDEVECSDMNLTYFNPAALEIAQ